MDVVNVYYTCMRGWMRSRVERGGVFATAVFCWCFHRVYWKYFPLSLMCTVYKKWRPSIITILVFIKEIDKDVGNKFKWQWLDHEIDLTKSQPKKSTAAATATSASSPAGSAVIRVRIGETVDFQYLKLQNFLREGEPPSRTHPQEVRSLRSLTCSNFPLFLIFLCLMPVMKKKLSFSINFSYDWIIEHPTNSFGP